MPITIATWNVNSLNVRLAHVLSWLASSNVDLLCLQELKLTDEKFPLDALTQAGYGAIFTGQKTYNGVAILYRLDRVPTPAEIIYNNPHFPDEQRRLIAATFGRLRVINGYFPNGQAPDSEKFIYKMNWLSGLHTWLTEALSKHENLCLLGDFNIAPGNLDVHDPSLWQDKIHCTPQERAAFTGLLALGLCDAWRMINPDQVEFSWWDYRMAGFRRNLGLRIDHILLTRAIPLMSSVIDKTPRAWEKPSDHTPVLATLDMDWS